MASHGVGADNGVRLPTNNLVSHNVFADYGIWDKQSACYHKALAPNNVFLNNVCFNSSRHGVNYQDGFGGGGIAEGNVMFNLNRETIAGNARILHAGGQELQGTRMRECASENKRERAREGEREREREQARRSV